MVVSKSEDDDEFMDESREEIDQSMNDDEPLDEKARISIDGISRAINDFIEKTKKEEPIFICEQVSSIVKGESRRARFLLAKQLFDDGIMRSIRPQYGDRQFNAHLQAFQYLVSTEAISFPDYLNILCSYEANSSDPSNAWKLCFKEVRRPLICKMLRMARSSLNCDEWGEREYSIMIEVVVEIYSFLMACIRSDTVYDNFDTLYEKTFYEYFALDSFFIRLLKISGVSTLKEDSRDYSLPDEVKITILALRKEIVFTKEDKSLSHEYNHSIVDSTVSVFVSARMNKSCEEMAAEISDAARMVGMGDLWKWKCALRTTLQLLYETPIDSPSRAFVESFYLQRLPRMIMEGEYEDAPSRDLMVKDLLNQTKTEMMVYLNKLPPDIWNLFSDALEKHGYPRSERVNMIRYNKNPPPNELITRSEKSVKAAKAIEDMQSTEDALSLYPSLFDPFCRSLNSVLAHLALEGKIQEKTSILADLNRELETRSEKFSGDQRWKVFDATFCVLLHTYYTVNRLTTRRIVCGDGLAKKQNREGVFYRWVSRFGRRDSTPNDNRDIENKQDQNKEERLNKARVFIQRLNSQCSLVEDESNYSDLFDVFPYMAQLLLDDATHSKESIKAAFSTLHSCPSIVYSLLMWLYCLDHSEARVSLVKNMDKVMRDMQGTDNVWRFMVESSSPLVKEMVKGKKTLDCVNSSSLVAAFMVRPLRYRYELANSEMIKKGITGASRGGFLPPWVIDLIESGNHAAIYDWVHIWVRNLTKLLVMDEMIEMGELLMGAAMIDPIQTCRAICQVLGDKILDDAVVSEGKPRPELQPTLFVFLSRFTAQMMLMGAWAIGKAEERLRAIENEQEEVTETPSKKPRPSDDMVKDLEDEYGMTRAHIDEMAETLYALFGRMMKTCRKGFLRNSVSAVSLILKEIAVSPDIQASQTLKKMVTAELLELVSSIDPPSVPFELMCAFVQDDCKRLEFLCKWRRSKGVEYPESDTEDEKAFEDGWRETIFRDRQ